MAARHLSLTDKPQLTMETTKALWDSSYQLRAICWNFNKIAKTLNKGEQANIKTEKIEKLAIYIYRHIKKVAVLHDTGSELMTHS